MFVLMKKKQPRLTQDLYQYLIIECEKAGVSLDTVRKKLNFSHQLIGQWKERTPYSLTKIDSLLMEIWRENLRNRFEAHNENMLLRFEIGSAEHNVILNRLQ